MSEPKFKHVWFDETKKQWVSAPFTYLPRYEHKPQGRRRKTRVTY